VRNNIYIDKLVLKENENLEVIELVSKCKDDTAAGFDNVTSKLLKYIIQLIVTPLVFIYNLRYSKVFFRIN